MKRIAIIFILFNPYPIFAQQISQEALISEINSLKSEQSLQSENITQLQAKLSELESANNELKKSFLLNIHHSQIGAILLLAGIFLEILGATLLASEALNKKFEPVYFINIKASLNDLALEDSQRSSLASLLSGIGSFLLIAGFNIQFIATLFIIGFSMKFIFLFGAVGICSSIGLLLYVSSQTPDQSLFSKICILLGNIIRIGPGYLFNILTLHRLIVCDYCLRPLRTNKASVLYIREKLTKNHPFLHTPYHFRIGHKYCFTPANDNILSEINRRHRMDKNEHTIIRICSTNQFTRKLYPVLIKFFSRHGAYWKDIRKEEGNPKPRIGEIEATRINKFIG